MKIELLEVSGIIPAFCALRLPFSKEPRSRKVPMSPHDGRLVKEKVHSHRCFNYNEQISNEDIALARKLILAGDEHGKCVRGVMAYIEITAPRYYWHEFVTYKVGCECLSSSSTMHTIAKGVTPDMFECGNEREAEAMANFLQSFIDYYNKEAKTPEEKEEAFLDIKRNIPEAFLQTRIFAISYQTLRRIYFQRRHHRLPEWRQFCTFIETLPFAQELIIPTKDNNE